MIYSELVDKNTTEKDLANLLQCDARQVRHLLNLDHDSKLSQLEAAFAILDLQPTEIRQLKRH